MNRKARYIIRLVLMVVLIPAVFKLGAGLTMKKLGFILISGFLDGLRPEPEHTIRDWAEEKRVLFAKGAAEEGPYRADRTPYVIDMMLDMSPSSSVEEIIVVKSAQLGLTEMGFNMIGYYVDYIPCPIAYVMPTSDTMERNVKQRINPMLQKTPSLASKIGKGGGDTLKQKDFGDGTLFFVGANSPASLRSIICRVAIMDEIDGYPRELVGEGSPIELFLNRMVTFGRKKKKALFSTPVSEDLSTIWKEFLKTDQRYYFLPCPHCKEKQHLVFEQLKWEKGNYNNVYYECIHCKGEIRDRHKTWMLAPKNGAEWIATKPENTHKKKKGYFINALYSPDGWVSFGQLAEEYDNAENDEPKMISFVTTKLALPYKVKGDAPPWQQLMDAAHANRIQSGEVWDSVCAITAGADVQEDRIEVEIVGWMKGRITQSIDYIVIEGPTNQPYVWDALGELLDTTYTVRSGKLMRHMPIKLMCIDSNYNTPYVHNFCKRYGPQRVVPIQGRDELQLPFTAPKAVNKSKAGKSVGKLKVWGVGSSYIKTLLYGWLRLEIDKETGNVPNGYCYLLPRDAVYFRGLTAEELVKVKTKTGTHTYQWEKKYNRNEPLDCRVYAIAAHFILGIDRWKPERWDAELEKLKRGLMPARETEREILVERVRAIKGENVPTVPQSEVPMAKPYVPVKEAAPAAPTKPKRQKIYNENYKKR